VRVALLGSSKARVIKYLLFSTSNSRTTDLFFKIPLSYAAYNRLLFFLVNEDKRAKSIKSKKVDLPIPFRENFSFPSSTSFLPNIKLIPGLKTTGSNGESGSRYNFGSTVNSVKMIN